VTTNNETGEVKMEDTGSEAPKPDAAAAPADAPSADGAAPTDGAAPAGEAQAAGGDAAEWEAMLNEKGDKPADEGTAERVLNQDEIDSLLGFDAGGGGNQERTGIQAIVNSALVSYERLPLLEIVFDRLVRMMTTSLSVSTISRRCVSATI
jgi:flagellar motor switch protein FliM